MANALARLNVVRMLVRSSSRIVSKTSRNVASSQAPQAIPARIWTTTRYGNQSETSQSDAMGVIAMPPHQRRFRALKRLANAPNAGITAMRERKETATSAMYCS